ncbi:hypothetical protein AABB24_012512, partial [Solanum stoloniferum]
ILFISSSQTSAASALLLFSDNAGEAERSHQRNQPERELSSPLRLSSSSLPSLFLLFRPAATGEQDQQPPANRTSNSSRLHWRENSNQQHLRPARAPSNQQQQAPTLADTALASEQQLRQVTSGESTKYFDNLSQDFELKFKTHEEFAWVGIYLGGAYFNFFLTYVFILNVGLFGFCN